MNRNWSCFEIIAVWIKFADKLGKVDQNLETEDDALNKQGRLNIFANYNLIIYSITTFLF